MAIRSRVIPASGPVSRRSSPNSALISVDLPAFGRPTIASLSGAALTASSSSGSKERIPPPHPLREGRQRLEQVAHAFAMFGADGHGFAHAKAEGFVQTTLTRAPFGLVGARITGTGCSRNQRAISSSSGVIPARVHHEQRDIRAIKAGLGLGTHTAGQAGWIIILPTGGVDDGKIQTQQLASPKRRSRVTPGWSSTSASFLPTRRLNKVDLPTLGRPIMII
jgi:hypothetical protein